MTVVLLCWKQLFYWYFTFSEKTEDGYELHMQVTSWIVCGIAREIVCVCSR